MSNEVNVVLGALSNTNAKFLNLKHFIESYNEVFGGNFKLYEDETGNVFTQYELNPDDSVYINIQKIRSGLTAVVTEFRDKLIKLSKTISNNKADETKTKINTMSKELTSLNKLIDKYIKSSDFTDTNKSDLKTNVYQFLSLMKNQSGSNLDFYKKEIKQLIEGSIGSNKSEYLNKLKTQLTLCSNEFEKIVENETETKIVTNDATNVINQNLNYQVFITKIEGLESYYTEIINELFKQNYLFNVVDNNGVNELEVIFNTNTTRDDFDNFSSDFGDIVKLNYDGFKPIEEHIHNLLNGNVVFSDFDVNDIFSLNNITFKDRGELLKVIEQSNDSTFNDNKITFSYTVVSSFSSLSIVGKYLKHTKGNNSYFTIVSSTPTSITISVKNKNINFLEGDTYSIYDDYNLDIKTDILQSSRNRIKVLESKIQKIGNDLIDSVNNLLIDVVMLYFKLMFGERTWLLDVLGDKIENFYMGGNKHGEMIRMIQSAFLWLRPPIVDGDYGDETGRGGQRFSTNYDPSDYDQNSSNLVNDVLTDWSVYNEGKYPIGIMYRVLYAIEIALEWYEKIFQILLPLMNIDLNDVDFDILDTYITGYKNPLSLSVLSPLIKVIRNLINIGITSISDWIVEQSESIEGALNGKSEDEIKSIICKRTREILLTNTLDLDTTLRNTIGNNLFSEYVVSKARKLIETNIDEAREYLLVEINRKISQGTYITNMYNKYLTTIRTIIVGVAIGSVIVKLGYVLFRLFLNFIENMVVYFINLLLANIEINLIQDSNEELIASYRQFKQYVIGKQNSVTTKKSDDITALLKAYNNGNTTSTSEAIIKATGSEFKHLRDLASLDKSLSEVESSFEEFNVRMSIMGFKTYKTDEFALFGEVGVNVSNVLRVEIEERLLLINTLITSTYKKFLNSIENGENDYITYKLELIYFRDQLKILNSFLKSNYEKLGAYDRSLITMVDDVVSNRLYNFDVTNKDLANGVLNSKDITNYVSNVVEYSLFKVEEIIDYEVDNFDDFKNLARLNTIDIIEEVTQDILLDHLEINNNDSTVKVNGGGYINPDEYNLIPLDNIQYMKSNVVYSDSVYYVTKVENVNDNKIFINDTSYYDVIYKLEDYVLINISKLQKEKEKTNVQKSSSDYTENTTICTAINDSSVTNDIADDDFGTDDFFSDLFNNDYRLSYVLPDFEAMFKFDWISQYIRETEKVMKNVAENLDKPEKFYKLWVKKNIQYFCGVTDDDIDTDTGETIQCQTNYTNFNEIPKTDICKVLGEYDSIEDIKNELNEKGIATNLEGITNNIQNQGDLNQTSNNENDSKKNNAKNNLKNYFDGNTADKNLLIKIGLVLLDEQSKNAELPDGVERNDDGSLSLKLLPLNGEQGKINFKPMDYYSVCEIVDKFNGSSLEDLENIVKSETEKHLQIFPKHIRNAIRGRLITSSTSITESDYCI